MGDQRQTRAELRGFFAGLVSDELLEAYLKLLAEGHCPKDDAEAFFGDRGLLDALITSGMAHLQSSGPTRPTGYVAAPPILALTGVLKHRQSHVLNELEAITEGHRRLGSTPMPIDIDVSGAGVSQLVKVAVDRFEITRLTATLMNAARRDFMSLENPITEMPFDDPGRANVPLPSFKGQVRCRSIYDASVMEHQPAVDTLRACVAGGEEARLHPSIPMKMQLADEQFALLPLTPTGTAGAVLISAPVIVTELRRHFEMLWEQAVPFDNPAAPPDCPLREVHLTILSMLGVGRTDDAMARRLGVSTTTVRRHIAEIERIMDAPTRAAAVLAAYRRGWIGQDGASNTTTKPNTP